MNSDEPIKRRSQRYEEYWFRKLFIYCRYCLRENPMGISRFIEQTMNEAPEMNALQFISFFDFPLPDVFNKWQEHAGIDEFLTARKALSIRCVAEAAIDDREEKELGLDRNGIIQRRLEMYRKYAAPKNWKGQ